MKTKSEAFDVWQWNVKKDGAIFADLAPRDDFVVMVNLTDRTADLRFYVVPTRLVDERLREDFQAWVSTPGQHGQQRNRANKQRHLSYRRHREFLEDFCDHWDLLWL